MDPKEERDAELVALALSGRPDRLFETALAGASPDARASAVAAVEAIAAFAAALPQRAPSPALRERLLASVAARQPRRAVLVLDMLNDHLTPGRVLEVPRARTIVPALRTRLATARTTKTPVVFIMDRHEPDDSDLDVWGAHNVVGTEGAEPWPDLAPEGNDRVVHKPSYSAFFNSNLDDVLDDLKVDTLVLTGCLTEVGIKATATEALQRGYTVEVPPDSQAGLSAETELQTLALLSLLVPYQPARDALLERTRAA